MGRYYNFDIDTVEIASVGDNPSKLKRAGISEELINKYTKARDRFRDFSPKNFPGTTEESHSKDEKAFRAVEDELQEALSKRYYTTMGRVNMTSVQKLLSDDSISAYSIEANTSVSRATIAKIRNGEADVLNLSVLNAIKLSDYFELLEYEEEEKQSRIKARKKASKMDKERNLKFKNKM